MPVTPGYETCECGALVEVIDSGNGFLYWAHVKRMRIEYGHAAVPTRESWRSYDPDFADRLANRQSA